MLRVLLSVASIGLTIYSLVDCIQTGEERIRFIPKLIWIVLIVLIPWIGPITWLIAGSTKNFPQRKRPTGGPRGPEDDPDFLRNL